MQLQQKCLLLFDPPSCIWNTIQHDKLFRRHHIWWKKCSFLFFSLYLKRWEDLLSKRIERKLLGTFSPILNTKHPQFLWIIYWQFSFCRRFCRSLRQYILKVNINWLNCEINKQRVYFLAWESTSVDFKSEMHGITNRQVALLSGELHFWKISIVVELQVDRLQFWQMFNYMNHPGWILRLRFQMSRSMSSGKYGG